MTLRKLLILDLNGTLLFRGKRRRPPGRADSESLRPVHPRPYLTSFRHYLFHPTTREWLDAMIWSSAQPHSVEDMLQRCFPAREEGGHTISCHERFLAVWARDTLGLSKSDYWNKVQTTKDLKKPWSSLKQRGVEHSSHTTLLLDDSPLKAGEQPYNHVCVPEYNAAVRFASVSDLVNVNSATYTPSSPLPAPAPTPPPVSHPDCILLAVIGILEALRYESDVAAWIRAGGLYASQNIHLPTASPTTESSRFNSAWFEHGITLAFWVAQGRKVLQTMGIAERH